MARFVNVVLLDGSEVLINPDTVSFMKAETVVSQNKKCACTYLVAGGITIRTSENLESLRHEFLGDNS